MRERLHHDSPNEPVPADSGPAPQRKPAEEDAARGGRAGEDLRGADADDPGPVDDDESGNAPSINLGTAWSELQGAIRRRIQPEQFETWFRRSLLTRLDTEVVCITVQNDFSKDWLKTYYAEVITGAVREMTGAAPRLELRVDSELTVEAPAPASAEADDVEQPAVQAAARATNGHGGAPVVPPAPRLGATRTNGAGAPTEPLHARPDRGRDGLVRGSDIGLNPKYTFDNFVVGPCNRFAHAAAVGVAELPGGAYNPLFLHGSVGLGKTHLLQSISYALLESWEGVRILFLSCETFVNHFIGALENADLQKFRNKYRNVDVLVVDDIHLLANKERTQEEFFHTFNTLYNAGKQIVLSSDSPPKDIPTLQERLVSRFKWGLVTEMQPPCYETRVAILKRKSRERGMEIPEPIASLIAERIEQNIRELEGAVNKLIGYATITNSEIDEELLRRAMPELFTQRSTTPSTEEIFSLVTETFGVKLSELQSKRRTNAVAYPRQIAMYLARKLTRHSLEEIGGFFGGRDHSTVLYAVEKIDKLMKSDEECRRIVSGLLDRLQAGPGI